MEKAIGLCAAGAMSMAGYRVRHHGRHRVQLPMKVRLIDSFNWHEALLVNLSGGGLCFQSRKAWSVEDLVELETQSIDREGKSQQRRLIGKIAWKKGQRYGVAFTGGDRRQKSQRVKKRSRHLKLV